MQSRRRAKKSLHQLLLELFYALCMSEGTATVLVGVFIATVVTTVTAATAATAVVTASLFRSGVCYGDLRRHGAEKPGH
jgi:hypothetical protein